MLVSLLVLIFILVVIAWWYSSNRRREAAFRYAKQYCKEHGVQLLDESVHCHRLSLTRDAGHIAVKAIYRFDYATHGTDRQHCHLTLIGRDLQWVGALKKSGDTPPPPKTNGKDSVLDFSHYKKLKSKNDDSSDH